MRGLSCNTCNKKFIDDSEQKLHYKSEWHLYNLKRKIAGVPGVTEAGFLARQSALAEEKKANETPMLYSCGLCGKGYRSSKAHAQHLNSKSHFIRASQGENHEIEENTIIRPLMQRTPVRLPPEKDVDSEESEVDPDEDMLDDADTDELDPTCCFMCDSENRTLESCMVHMHKKHGLFIPDVEYLKDPKGLLTYLGLKVRRDFLCLYCNERCHPFSSLEAVRKHMEAKGHCKVRYGDGDDDDEEVELEDFYDYSSRYMDKDGKQLVAANDDGGNSAEFGCGGCELVIKRRTDSGVSAKTLGYSEFLRYYRQQPRPAPAHALAISIALASTRCRSLGLSTVQLKECKIRMKDWKEMRRCGKEAMKLKLSMKSIFNRPLCSA